MVELLRVEDPKRFLSAPILREITDVVRDSFGSRMTVDDVREHMTEPDTSYLFMDNGKIVGMGSKSIINVYGIPVTHIEGIAIARDMQGQGLSKMFMDEIGTVFIAGKTQNPNAYKCFKNACSRIVPDQSRYKTSSERSLEYFRDEFARKEGFDIDNLGVIRGCYGTALYDVMPTSESEGALFQSTLRVNAQKGDSVVFFGEKK